VGEVDGQAYCEWRVDESSSCFLTHYDPWEETENYIKAREIVLPSLREAIREAFKALPSDIVQKLRNNMPSEIGYS